MFPNTLLCDLASSEERQMVGGIESRKSGFQGERVEREET